VLDLLVVGGGPVGLVTALHAKRSGMAVAVVEPRSAPIDKACGEGLMPPAVSHLRQLGVPLDGWPFRGIRYADSRHSAVADFAAGVGIGVRRTALHAALAATVAEAGIDVVRRRVTDVKQDGAVTAAGMRAGYLVGADGLHSTVRQLSGLGRPATDARPRWGLRAHYACAPWSEHVEVHWAAHAEAYVTPLADDCVGVAVLSSQRNPYRHQLAAFPELAAWLPDRPVGPVRGAGPLRQDVRRRLAGRVLLVGDAAGYLDALTGEGLAIGFACGQALVARLVAGDAAGYERDYRAITRRYRLITSALLAAAQRRSVRGRLVATAERLPRVFELAVGQLAR
jgi:flavin-dependent dehydrogenase